MIKCSIAVVCVINSEYTAIYCFVNDKSTPLKQRIFNLQSNKQKKAAHPQMYASETVIWHFCLIHDWLIIKIMLFYVYKLIDYLSQGFSTRFNY